MVTGGEDYTVDVDDNFFILDSSFYLMSVMPVSHEEKCFVRALIFLVKNA